MSAQRIPMSIHAVQRNAAVQAVLDMARAEYEAGHGSTPTSPIEARTPISSIREMNELAWRTREAKYEPLLSTIRRMKEDGKDDQSIAAACGVEPARVIYVRGVWGIAE